MSSPVSETGSTPALDVRGELLPRFDEILTPDALAFVAGLAERFRGRRDALLQARADRYAAGRPGDRLDFRADTAAIRADPSWRVAPPAPGLADRRVEMTGPTTRKMVVNALNSGAKAWMADFEDATAPTWFNVVDGQLNLHDAIRGQVDFTDERGKRYAVGCRDADDHGPAPRLAPGRRSSGARRPSGAGRRSSTSGCTSSTTRRP